MSLNRNKSFFKEYAKSSYMQKINPEFQGIAKKYYNQKKEHEKLHLIKTKLDKEVAYVQRMERSLQNHLQKKKRQLEYTKQVNNRVINDVRRREWLQEFKTQRVKNNQEKAQLLKYESERKLKDAKMYMTESKRSMANLNRAQNSRIKELKTIKKAKQWDMNRSRASELYQFKKDVRENTNKFYQTRNNSSMSGYTKRIQSYKKFETFDSKKIKQLENKKQSLNERYSKEKQQFDILSQQIEKIKKQARMESSMVRSRLKMSRSSGSLSAKSQGTPKHAKNNSQLASRH